MRADIRKKNAELAFNAVRDRVLRTSAGNVSTTSYVRRNTRKVWEFLSALVRKNTVKEAPMSSTRLSRVCVSFLATFVSVRKEPKPYGHN
jgi:hypothetical protein